MKLITSVDRQIQKSLMSKGITFDIDDSCLIKVKEYYIDNQANAGMLYLKHKCDLPDGELLLMMVDADNIYGVFHNNNEALIIEVNTLALSE